MKATDRHPKLFATILRLEHYLLHNSRNLLYDACILFKHGSYPTAFALAVLAYEELGKLHLIDHVGFESCLSEKPIRLERLANLFSGKYAYNHRLKQEWAFTKHKKIYAESYFRRIEKRKQDAFYVGFERGRISAPERISSTMAYDQIKRVVDLIKITGDLLFCNLFEDSNAKSRVRAKRYLLNAKKALASIKSPRNRHSKSSARSHTIHSSVRLGSST